MDIETIKVTLQFLKLPFFSFIGAFILYMLNRLHDKQPFSLAKAINIDIGPNAKSKTILIDMFLSSILGVLIVIPLTAPSTIPQAIIAGLGMTGVFSAHAKTNK